jgi:serine/threonine protein kinase
LRREVEELLRYDGAAESFMQDNALVAAQEFEPEHLSQTIPQLLPGRSIGAYKILSLLERGGMGVVYRARDERLRRDVAIKVLPASFANDADRLVTVCEEWRALGATLRRRAPGTEGGCGFVDGAERSSLYPWPSHFGLREWRVGLAGGSAAGCAVDLV